MADRQFVAVEQELSWTAARQYCMAHFSDLASIHNAEEQRQAARECRELVKTDALKVCCGIS